MRTRTAKSEKHQKQNYSLWSTFSCVVFNFGRTCGWNFWITVCRLLNLKNVLATLLNPCFIIAFNCITTLYCPFKILSFEYAFFTNRKTMFFAFVFFLFLVRNSPLNMNCPLTIFSNQPIYSNGNPPGFKKTILLNR